VLDAVTRRRVQRRLALASPVTRSLMHLEGLLGSVLA
jgi:hypothetical protein